MLIHASDDCHLDSSYFLAIMDSAVNIHVHVFVLTYVTDFTNDWELQNVIHV